MMTQSERRRNAKDARRAACSLGIVGFSVAGVVVFGVAGGGIDSWPLPIGAGVGAAAVGYALWRAMCERESARFLQRRVLAGAFTGLLAHPVAWYVAIILNFLLNRPLFPGTKTVGPLEGIRLSLVYSFFSVILAGWLTIPLGAITGWLVARTSQKTVSSAEL